ncbi:MAG: phosphoadenylyl-sulfate reductase [Acidocella sp.]|nr:phosphoadenylyl-sulfate reductase [Acidocella sp.]
MLDFLNSVPAEIGLENAILKRFAGKIALVSAFGTESAIVLHMVASIDRSLPVIFLDTLKMFPETLAYRDDLTARLGLTNVHSLRPDASQLAAYDPDEKLWQNDPDTCCAIRKSNPLDAALNGMQAWITGRKRSQGGARANLQFLEPGPDNRVTVNPLALWDDAQIATYFETHNLPRHPLQAQGYASVGCMNCTLRTGETADKRAGRWAGLNKTECGIHLPRLAIA